MNGDSKCARQVVAALAQMGKGNHTSSCPRTGVDTSTHHPDPIIAGHIPLAAFEAKHITKFRETRAEAAPSMTAMRWPAYRPRFQGEL
jgi:hypothetical protein